MVELLGSSTKAQILLYLGLRGGASGRRLARALKLSPTPVFKALKQLLKAKVIALSRHPPFYALNPEYLYHDQLLAMIHKFAEKHPSSVRKFMPMIAEDRAVDPIGVYELLALRKPATKTERLSDTLRKLYD